MQEIIDAPIEGEMQTSYVDYAMSVIISRALPDARDGLKPAQRRILYSMYKLGNTHDQPTKKSARIVGDVIGKYHPHGDQAVYETMVRMAQDFSLNHRLVEGQGNMGSIDGDPPAHMRYTEVRLEKMAEDMIDDIEKESVRMSPNFDSTEKEPEILPAKVPNLLVNGASGIAVGVATSIMPHNLSEVCDAVVAYVDNPEITPGELMSYIKGPDFPTGGSVFYNGALQAAYTSGRGTVVIRGRHKQEKIGNRDAIVITEIPYAINKSTLVENIANLVRSKRVTDIADLRDESGKEGVRIVIELKQGGDPDMLLNQLYKHTELQSTMPVMNIAVVGKELVTLNIRQYMKIFVDHRAEVIRNRTNFDLRVASDRLHIVEGLLVAVNDIDNVVATIKGSKDVKEARAALIERYTLSEKQANAVLDMRLSRLTSLEVTTLDNEKSELNTNIEGYKQILADQNKILGIIKSETREIKSKYGKERKTFIDQNAPVQELSREDLLTDEETTIILTKNNYVKRITTKAYREQDRGGRGVKAIELKEGDFVKQVTYCMLKDYLLMISSKGRAYWLKAYLVPEEGRYGIGKALVNLVQLTEGEKVASIINTRSFQNAYLTFITAKGRIKRVAAEKFSRPRANGINAIPIQDGDELADIMLSDGKSELFIATQLGKALRFVESDIRPMGRQAAGIRGIKLNPSDRVVNIIAARPGDSIATVSERGYGKVTELNRYRLQRRGGKGVINLKVKEKTGNVVKALRVGVDDNIFMINSKGISITFPVSEVRITGRGASGVRLMKVDAGAKVVDAQAIARAKP